MNKLDRFRFGSYHKRRIVGFLTILAAVFVVALGLLALLGIFSFRSELVSVRLSSNSNGYFNDGVSINLDEIPSSNRISCSDFERESNYNSFTIADCSGDYVFFDANSGVGMDSVVAGSEIRILSLDNDGVMSLRYSGLVNSFDSARFGLNIPIDDVNGFFVNDTVTDVASISGTVVALTESGKLVMDITSDDFVKVLEDEDGNIISISSICKYGSYIYALSENDEFYVSSDGRNFSLLYAFEDETTEIRTFAGVGNSVAFITDDNRYFLVSGNTLNEISVSFDVDENTIIVSSSDKLLIVTSSGEVYSSANGLVFDRVLDEIGLFENSFSAIDYKSLDNVFYFLTSDGRIVILNLDSITESSSIDLSSISPVMMEVADSGSIIVITSDNKACLVAPDGSFSDLSASNGVIDAVYCGVGDRLIMRSGNNLYFVTVLSAIQVNSTIPEDAVNPGDLCYIRTVGSRAFDEGNWFISSENTSISFYNSFDSVITDSSVRILGVGDGVHAISQPLYGNATDDFTYNTFYRMSLKLRSDSPSMSAVKVWIYGEEFGEVGFTVTDVTSNLEEYSFVFALTGNNRLTEEDKLYFNISFDNDGVLFVDDVYLGEDRYAENSIPYEFEQNIISGNPAAIRLNNLNFLAMNNSDEILYGLGTNSLETSLALVKAAESEPWFVIGSYADADSIEKFMNYMCGSVSSDYGKLRIDNGTAIPWTRQFDTIYIEICDSDSVYLTDMQRGAYVSYVKSLFIQSSYYSEIKDRVVFLDGMTYEGGVVHSTADFHSMKAQMDLNRIGELSTVYSDINYNVPRMPLIGVDVGEYISVMSFEGEYNQSNNGVLTAPLIVAESSFARMISVDIAISPRPVDTESISIFTNDMTVDLLGAVSRLSFVDGSHGLYYDLMPPMDSSSEHTVEEISRSCVMTLVENNGVAYFVSANISDTQQQFTIDGIDVSSAHMIRYAANGSVIADRSYRQSDIRITLQPGETIVIFYDNK